MATKFTNKYMQVFQNYNEFGEHSADYVRGEDHIAFLIEENEVIYWLYLEQVWRPLNVRTTTTGQLEDGRTKVAVRLEYVKGGQKYTSVPNIPDPERITSMSHFLEDYLDIEEVNVTGTVNLTDLSYAFAGSKIRDFSMLDTSNVNNISRMIDNINDSSLSLNINLDINNFTNSENITSANQQAPIRLKELNFKNIGNKYNGNIFIDLLSGNITTLNLDDFSVNIESIYSSNSISINTINSNNLVKIDGAANTSNNHARISNINSNRVSLYVHGFAKNSTVYINCNSAKITSDGQYSYKPQNKIVINEVDNLDFYLVHRNAVNFVFGYGIKYPNNITPNITRYEVFSDQIVGNFWFTTPIVDDAFYAKYAQYNHPISIFQYKTTFEEVADVNITEATDSSLIYVYWRSIDFDTSNMNIEINNIIDLDINYNNINFNKVIIDNSNFKNLDYNDIPWLLQINRLTFNEGYISGNYKGNGFETDSRINSDYKFKDIILWDYVTMDIMNGDDLTNKNIKFKYKNNNKWIRLHIGYGDNNTDLSNLIEDNNINVNIYCAGGAYNQYLSSIKYIDGVIYNIGNSGITYKEDKLQIANITAFYNIINENNKTHFNQYIELDAEDNIPKKESVYLNGLVYILNFFTPSNKSDSLMKTLHINNIYGDNINIILDYKFNNQYDNYNIEVDNYKHIDIATVSCHYVNSYSEFTIRYFNELDDESTINLITKLIDNTSESIKTIYMYRSQANIIGEENIAAAVAKNYEFAIIEN